MEIIFFAIVHSRRLEIGCRQRSDRKKCSGFVLRVLQGTDGRVQVSVDVEAKNKCKFAFVLHIVEPLTLCFVRKNTKDQDKVFISQCFRLLPTVSKFFVEAAHTPE